jgi:hypothetical protein
MRAEMPERLWSRRFIVGSPFDALPAPALADEQYSVQDRVTHDRYGLGRVTVVEDDTTVVVDFGSRLMRIRLPCPRMTKL